MTFAKFGLTLAIGASLLATSFATVETASADGWHRHHMYGRHHYRRNYTYGSRTDARRQTRSGGPVGGLRDQN
jgi:hypothetical protein